MSTLPTKILVLDANQRSALAVVRSLGRHSQLQVLAADETPTALAGRSRYCAAYHRYPSPRREPQNFARWLDEFIEANAIDWIFPVTEISSQSILTLQPLPGRCRIPFADLDTVMALADKGNLIQLAGRLGIPHPSSRWFADGAALNPADVSRFPVVLKPCLSRLRLADGWLDTSVHIARDARELADLLAHKTYLQHHPFLLQEFIPGSGAGIFALYDNGRPVTFFAHRRLREKPPRGGVSVLSESARPNPQMLDMARQLLDAVQWHGVAMVEFRVAPDGTPYLMEVNTRFWGSLQLAIDAGIDFPYWLYQVCNGQSPQIADYRIGQRLRWLLGDFDSLYLTLRDRQFSTRHKFAILRDFLTPRPFSTRHEINRWRDFGPAWHELRAYLKTLRR